MSAHSSLGTTSLRVASSLGLVDGTRATREPAVRLAHGLVAAALGVPLTCDVEDGFDGDAAAVAELVASLGVEGVNLEDASGGVFPARSPPSTGER